MNAVTKPKSLMNTAIEAVFDQNAANFWLQKINPIWSVNQALGKIIAKSETAQGTVSLTIQVNSKFQVGLPGQHHPVIIKSNGRRYERTYSLTLLKPQQVLLTVKKVDQGLVSHWLADEVRIGEIIEFGQPYGDMTLDSVQQPLLLLAAGSGITPMYSLVRAALAANSNFKHAVQLMYWVKTPADAVFADEFKQLAQQQSQFTYNIFYTQSDVADARINPANREGIEQLDQYAVYACGPSGFVQVAEQVFAGHAKRFKSEAFSLNLADDNEQGEVQVTLTRSKQTVTIPKGQSILASLEQQNIFPKHGCRMGICNKCACNKAQGATKNLVNGEENTEPGNLLKICINSAKSDLIIDL